MNFTEHQVEQYEILADTLNNFDYVSENMEVKFLMFILNIESLLPNSNIFNYVKKYDEYKQMVKDTESEIMNIEWSIEKNSLESEVFNTIKQKLIIEKKLNYGSI